jgi:hypothetical protein
VHKSEIDVAELRLLYRKICAAHNSTSGSPIKQSFFQHWQQLSGVRADTSSADACFLTLLLLQCLFGANSVSAAAASILCLLLGAGGGHVF